MTRFFLTLGLSDKQAQTSSCCHDSYLVLKKPPMPTTPSPSINSLAKPANAADSGKDHTTPDWEIPCRGSMLCLNSVISSLSVVSPIAGVKRSPYLG